MKTSNFRDFGKFYSRGQIISFLSTAEIVALSEFIVSTKFKPFESNIDSLFLDSSSISDYVSILLARDFIKLPISFSDTFFSEFFPNSSEAGHFPLTPFAQAILRKRV